MRTVRITGKLVSQPVIVSSPREWAVLILVETIKGYEEFYFTCPIISNKGIGIRLVKTNFSHITLSSVGDMVEFDVMLNQFNHPTNEILNFHNITRNLGNLGPK